MSSKEIQFVSRNVLATHNCHFDKKKSVGLVDCSPEMWKQGLPCHTCRYAVYTSSHLPGIIALRGNLASQLRALIDADDSGRFTPQTKELEAVVAILDHLSRVL